MARKVNHFQIQTVQYILIYIYDESTIAIFKEQLIFLIATNNLDLFLFEDHRTK